MNKELIAITGMGSISPLGNHPKQVWQTYQSQQSVIYPKYYNEQRIPVASLPEASEERLQALLKADRKYSQLDRSVLMAIAATRQAINQTGWYSRKSSATLGVNIGSSRGATGLFEKHHSNYTHHPDGKVPLLSSPTTTLGNLSSWVGYDIQTEGPLISHSVTCSTAMHAIGNAIAWLRADMAAKFIAGGTEASLTGFTIAQMKALKIYTQDIDHPYPCRPCTSEKNPANMLALGEGAAVFALEKVMAEEVKSRRHNILAVIEAFGYGTEQIRNGTAISKEGTALQKSMKMALAHMQSEAPVDLLLMHAPGTIQGDAAERKAVQRIWGDTPPICLSNKWVIGHTLGASGALSLEYALLILSHNAYVDFPYPATFANAGKPIRKIMINATGFGGNTTSLLVSHPDVLTQR